MKHDESHGWAWDAIGLGDQNVLLNCIRETAQNGTLVEEKFIKDDERDIKAYYMKSPQNCSVQMCTLHKIKAEEKVVSIESFYPLLEGIENEITVTDTHVWENGLEGEVIGEFNEMPEVSFFAPFFYKDFADKKSGNVRVSLAGIANSISIPNDEEMKITKGPLYDMQLKEFLSENPDKTKDDFKHINVSMKGASMFFPTEYTSYFQFRSTVQSIETITALNVDVVKMKVCLVICEGKNLDAFIYTSKYNAAQIDLKVGDDIQGVVMLSGCLVG